MDLLRAWIRAEALEELLSRETPGVSSPRPLSPALPAAAALRTGPESSPDLFSLRVGSPAAALAMGATPVELLRQALARATSPAQGRDPGGFATDLDRGLLAPVSVPGLLMEVLAGVAFAVRRRGESRVALLVDDTAGSGAGDWHEGLNFAAVQRVPMVVVMDDTRRSPSDAAAGAMTERAEAYGFAVHPAAGDDPGAIRDATARAVERARAGEGLQVVDVRPLEGDPWTTLVEAEAQAARIDELGLTGLRADAAEEMSSALDVARAEPEARGADVVPSSPMPAPGVPRVRTPRPWS